MLYKISPSDLTYLYDECKFCFYVKVKHGISQPFMLPRIFTTIASLQEQFFSGRRTEEFCRTLPPGVVKLSETYIASEELPTVDAKDEYCIGGKFDIVIEFDDGTYGIIDFKTAEQTAKKTELYSRQLHAYAFTLENPGKKSKKLSPISKLGLLYFKPSVCDLLDATHQIISGDLYFDEVKYNIDSFYQFMTEVVNLLDKDMPSAQNCASCIHCSTGRTCKIQEYRQFKCEDCVCSCCRFCSYRVKLADGAQLIKQEAVSRAEAPKCPKCGAEMAKRKGSFGIFWGCTNYPGCKGTKNIN